MAWAILAYAYCIVYQPAIDGVEPIFFQQLAFGSKNRKNNTHTHTHSSVLFMYLIIFHSAFWYWDEWLESSISTTYNGKRCAVLHEGLHIISMYVQLFADNRHIYSPHILLYKSSITICISHTSNLYPFGLSLSLFEAHLPPYVWCVSKFIAYEN